MPLVRPLSWKVQLLLLTVALPTTTPSRKTCTRSPVPKEPVSVPLMRGLVSLVLVPVPKLPWLGSVLSV